MQKFNTLLVFVASMLMLFSAQAQTAITNAPAIPADRSDITTEYVTPEGKPVARPRADRPEGSTQIVLDYGTTSGDPTGFFWSSNARFGTTDTLMTDLFGVTFDSLIDENGVTYNKDNFFSKIDAIRFRMRLRKASPATVTDSVVIQVLESTNADVVWQEVKEYTAPVNGTDDAFVLEEVFPDTVICDNSFSVRIFLLGPTTDTLHFVSTYNPGTCPQTGAAACGTPQSNIPFNSFFGLYLQGMRFGAGLFLDCDSDGMVGPCESYFLQNNDIRVSVRCIPSIF